MLTPTLESLESLASLARRQSATFRLTIDAAHVSASWKSRGHRDEVVSYDGDQLRDTLNALLGRLGLRRLPTFDLILEHLTEGEQDQLRDLIGQVRVIRDLGAQRLRERNHPSLIEPRLASPRSSLHPDNVALCGVPRDVRTAVKGAEADA